MHSFFRFNAELNLPAAVLFRLLNLPIFWQWIISEAACISGTCFYQKCTFILLKIVLLLQ